MESFDHSAYRGLDEEKRFNDLIDYAVNNHVGFFLVDEKSRFARNRYTRVVNEEKLRRAGVKLVGVSEPEYDPKSIHGVWMDGISITKNEAYSVEIAYHVMKGMTENAAQRDPETGWCFKNGGTAPDGYKNVRVIRGKDRRNKDIIKLLWEIDEQRAPIIRHIVLNCWLEQGMSYSAIVDYLNSPTIIKFNGSTDPILSSKGSKWSKTTIREICMRALEGAYSGIYYWNRTGRDLRGTGQKWKNSSEWQVVENAHPAIISLEELEKLRNIKGKEVKERKRNSTVGKRKARTENSPYLFSGNNLIGEPFFVCMNCGGAINGQQVVHHHYYLCSTYKNKGKNACDKGVNIPKDYIEKEVLKAIKNQFTIEKIKNISSETTRILKENQQDKQEAINYLHKALEDNQKYIGAGNRNRTGTVCEDRRILSPVRLPIPPLRHIVVEAPSRFELENKGFAVLCLTTWLWRLAAKIIITYIQLFCKYLY
jgi:DNA invertase Pin-like site-specific DNA recombinase